nr:hypothetical protein CFP56_13188 [Quercus suber]
MTPEDGKVFTIQAIAVRNELRNLKDPRSRWFLDNAAWCAQGDNENVGNTNRAGDVSAVNQNDDSCKSRSASL